MPAGLAQEELEGVGGRLPRDGGRLCGGGRLGRRRRLVLVGDVVDDVDPAGLELAVEALDLERVEAERLEVLVQLALADGAALLGASEQRSGLGIGLARS